MELAELEALILQGESETLEFKKSTSLLDNAAQTLCGFLNRKGGRVLVGVTAEGRVVGQNVSDNTLLSDRARSYRSAEATFAASISDFT